MAIRSPFPGMDPFLELEWEDVHTTLIVHAKEQLQALLPSDLKARSQQRVFLEADEPALQREIVPDAYILERAEPSPGGGTAVAEMLETAVPLIVRVTSEPVRQGYIELRDSRSGGRVVTVIEFIRPSNKVAGKGRELFNQKREECWEAGVNFVEIDLTRRRPLNLMLAADQLPDGGKHPYHACVWRATVARQIEAYAFHLRSPLPAIRIPLRSRDDDIPLSLQPLIDHVVTAGAYDDIDYSRELDPPLSSEDVAWLQQRLRERQTA